VNELTLPPLALDEPDLHVGQRDGDRQPGEARAGADIRNGAASPKPVYVQRDQGVGDVDLRGFVGVADRRRGVPVAVELRENGCQAVDLPPSEPEPREKLSQRLGLCAHRGPRRASLTFPVKRSADAPAEMFPVKRGGVCTLSTFPVKRLGISRRRA